MAEVLYQLGTSVQDLKLERFARSLKPESSGKSRFGVALRRALARGTKIYQKHQPTSLRKNSKTCYRLSQYNDWQFRLPCVPQLT